MPERHFVKYTFIKLDPVQVLQVSASAIIPDPEFRKGIDGGGFPEIANISQIADAT